MYGLVLIGLIFNIIAMKHYPLTKEKMQEIQEEIAAIKAKNRNGVAAEQNVSHVEKAVVDSAV